MNKNLSEIVSSWTQAIELLVKRIRKESSEQLAEMIFKADRIFVTGQGRSGMVAQCLATRLAQMDFNVNIPGLATCQKIEASDLMIAISCSGTTRTTIEFVKISKNSGAKVAVLSAFAKSTLAELADEVVILPSADADIRNICKYAVGPNNNMLFEQAALLYLDALVYILLEKRGVSADIITKRHTNLE